MNVDVDKIKDKFLNRISNLYNAEVYFIEICNKFPEKYPLPISITDLQLQIFFEENNKVVIGGKLLKYCEKGSKKKIKIKSISDEISTPDITINNYFIEDKWNQIDW